MIDDIFCKIIKGQLPARVVMEENEWLAIDDIHPQAKVHILIISKKHITSLLEAKAEDVELLGCLVLAASKVAQKVGLTERGFRLIINEGRDGGQLVPHLHIHLLGGQHLGPKLATSS